MRRILIATTAAFGLSSCSGGLLGPSASGGWTGPQKAWFEIQAAIAAENTAVAARFTPGLSGADIVDIRSAQSALSSAVQAQAPILASGGAAAAQGQAAALAAIMAGVNSLGAVLSATHGATVDTKTLATAVGLDALAQLPALIGAYAQVNSGFVPGPGDMAAAIAALQAAAAL